MGSNNNDMDDPRYKPFDPFETPKPSPLPIMKPNTNLDLEAKKTALQSIIDAFTSKGK